MKPNLYLRACIILFFLSGCALNTSVSTRKNEVTVYRTIIPTPNDLAVAWFGTTADDLYYYRLFLFENGKGSLVYAFAEDAPVILPVTGWRLQGRAVEIEADSSRSVLKPVTIRGTASLGVLRLTISGSGWEQAVRFRKEEDFERRYNKLTSATTSEKK